jgi:hypothetical protein
LGLIYQDGSNTYGYWNPGVIYGDEIGERYEYKTVGFSTGIDIDYHFPKTETRKVAKERWLVGINGIYSHLPNEVDYYSYGFHVGMNFLSKNEEGKWKF